MGKCYSKKSQKFTLHLVDNTRTLQKNKFIYTCMFWEAVELDMHVQIELFRENDWTAQQKQREVCCCAPISAHWPNYVYLLRRSIT